MLAFTRGAGLCVVNLGHEPFALPSDWTGELVVASEAPDEPDARVVPPDRAAWYVLDRDPAFVPGPADGVREDSLIPQLQSATARETTGRRAIITP